MYKNILIVCSHTKINFSIFNDENSYVIGVERGCLDLIEKGIKIDLAISDFDQVTDEELNLIKTNAISFEKISCEKDFLDGEIAIIKAAEISPSAKIIFVANPTKRYDMNFSGINLVVKYGINFINDYTSMHKIDSGKTEISFNDFECFTFISFFAITQTLISIKNMKYNANNLTLNPFDNLAISNGLVLNKNPQVECDNPIIMIATK